MTCCSVWELQFQRYFVFCQAEDGIRDLVRSRGLGDVYKRQRQRPGLGRVLERAAEPDAAGARDDLVDELLGDGPVSYTHLTLPTSDLV